MEENKTIDLDLKKKISEFLKDEEKTLFAFHLSDGIQIVYGKPIEWTTLLTLIANGCLKDTPLKYLIAEEQKTYYIIHRYIMHSLDKRSEPDDRIIFLHKRHVMYFHECRPLYDLISVIDDDVDNNVDFIEEDY